MANITAVSGGGYWSATTTWSSGTVPTSSDIVDLNGQTIKLFGSSTIYASLISDGGLSVSGFTFGGGSGTYTINADISGSGATFFTSNNVPVSVIVNGAVNLSGGELFNNATGISSGGLPCGLTVNGDVVLSGGAYLANQVVQLAINGNVSMSGSSVLSIIPNNFTPMLGQPFPLNFYYTATVSGTMTTSSSFAAISGGAYTNGMITLNEVVLSGSGSLFEYGAFNPLPVKINKLTVSSASTVHVGTAFSDVVIGECDLGSFGVIPDGICATLITGSLTAASTAQVGTNGKFNNTFWVGQAQTGYTPNYIVPADSDVRLNTSFGTATSTMVGSLAVPPPSTVLEGVATDDTVGTAPLTAATIAAAILQTPANLLATDGSGNVTLVAAEQAQLTAAAAALPASSYVVPLNAAQTQAAASAAIAAAEPIPVNITEILGQPVAGAPMSLSVQSPVSSGTITLTGGDDYSTGSGNGPIVLTISNFAAADLTGASASLVVEPMGTYLRTPAGTPVSPALTASATLSLETGTLSATVPLTAAQTGSLSLTTPPTNGSAYRWKLVYIDASGLTTTVSSGDLTVVRP